LLYFAPLAPHGPSTPAWRHLNLYSGIQPYRSPSFGEPDISDKPFWLQNAPWIKRDEAGNRQLSPGEIEGIDRRRLAQIRSLAAVDEGIDAMLSFLDRTNRLKNTFVLFLSDNGSYWGEHYLKGKNAPYEESIRVPFAIRYPPLIPPTQSQVDPSHLVANIDIAPTVYELAGLTVPPQVRGESLVPLLKNPTTRWRKSLFFEGWPDRPGDIGDPNQCRPPFRAIRDQRFIYVEYQTNKGTGVPCKFTRADRAELYDLIADPYQTENLSGHPSFREIEAELKKEMNQYPKLDAPVHKRNVTLRTRKEQ
jgi:arylsulfatase A-like enzyme